jgi:hypothetical protein
MSPDQTFRLFEMNIGQAVNLDCAGRKIEHERRALPASELAVEHTGPHLHGKSGLDFEEANARNPDLSPLLRKKMADTFPVPTSA